MSWRMSQRAWNLAGTISFKTNLPASSKACQEDHPNCKSTLSCGGDMSGVKKESGEGKAK